MKQRINFGKVQPAAYDAMEALDAFVEHSSISKEYRELIKIRASQINGCSYCVDMHTKDARKIGETEQRIHRCEQLLAGRINGRGLSG